MDSWPSPPPFPFAELRTVDEIDAVKGRLHSLMLDLNSVRNTFAPINVRLPREVLLQIFRALANSFDAEAPLIARDYQRAAGHYKWIIVTHVCRAWRSIALGDRSLWSRILVDVGAPAKTFLERAGDRIPLSFWGSISAEALVKYSQRLLHVGWIYMNTTARSYIDSACPNGMLALPVLETLCLTTPDDTALGLSMPRLKTFYTNGPWAMAETVIRRSPTLVHLEIYRDCTSRHNTYQVSQILRLLQALPALQELCIINGIAPDPPTSGDGVTLTRLRKIALQQTDGDASAIGCAYLLSHLSFPVSADIEIDGLQPGHTYQQYEEIVLCLNAWILSRYLPATPSFNHLSVALRDAYGGHSHIRLTFSTLDPPTERRLEGSLTLSLCLNHTFNGPLWGAASERRVEDEVLCDIVHRPLTAKVAHLRLEQSASHLVLAEDVAVWRFYLASLPLHVQSLSLSASSFDQRQTVALIELMQSCLDTNQNCFPQLEMLNAARWMDWRRLPDPYSGHRSVEQRLVDVLWRRRERGLGPTRLNFAGCTKEVDDIEIFDGFADEWRMVKTKRTRLAKGLPWDSSTY